MDTPGIGAAGEAGDVHQNRTAEYMHLHQQLRERHEQETRHLDSTADAVIYLTDAVARVSDRDFLEEFGMLPVAGQRAVNAVGVMARIDQQQQVIDQRHDLAAKIAKQLERQLNTVVPLSAGLRFCALAGLPETRTGGCGRWRPRFPGFQPKKPTDLLESDEMYKTLECPLSYEERGELLDPAIPWTVFTTIAKKVAVPAESLRDRGRTDGVGWLSALASVAGTPFFSAGG